MKRAIWISYDLGVRGDYEGIYGWLEDHGAKECISNLAFVNYEIKGNLAKCLKRDIESAIEVNKRTRIYAIWRDSKTKKMKGRFIFGGRRVPPWTGYGSAEERGETDES